MNKEQLVELIKGALEAKREEKVSKKAVAEFLKDIDTVVEVLAAAEGLDADSKVKVGSYITLEKKMVEAKSGEITRPDGSKLAYETEAHPVVKAKVSKSLDVK